MIPDTTAGVLVKGMFSPRREMLTPGRENEFQRKASSSDAQVFVLGVVFSGGSGGSHRLSVRSSWLSWGFPREEKVFCQRRRVIGTILSTMAATLPSKPRS